MSVGGACSLASVALLIRLPVMPKPLSADDILPLVKSLTPRERVRLMRLIVVSPGNDAAAYDSIPPGRDEFSSEQEPLEWDAEGWEGIG